MKYTVEDSRGREIFIDADDFKAYAEVLIALSADTTIHYAKDDRKKAIETWNRRADDDKDRAGRN